MSGGGSSRHFRMYFLAKLASRHIVCRQIFSRHFRPPSSVLPAKKLSSLWTKINALTIAMVGQADAYDAAAVTITLFSTPSKSPM